ncbi:MAG: MoxR family ATPase [Chloroflexi bacterium]|nr:MoxR family ATPase [Chloroflexota bacterium]
MSVSEAPREVADLRETARAIEQEIGRVIVGQDTVVRGAVIALLAGGHVLLEGVPGLGKTMLVRTLADALHLHYSRIQFTPDLMPADVSGTNVLLEDASGNRQMSFQPGPIFANLVLADEINRATPKTQAALLEAMQEQTVTVATTAHRLPRPFFVLATQNPIEMEGTYPLPEAELDRFFFKLNVTYPSREQLNEIVRRTTAGHIEQVQRVADARTLQAMQALVRQVPIASHVVDYAVRLVLATHPENGDAPEPTTRFVRYGASPRAAQAIVLAAKIFALLNGRLNVSFEDVRRVSPPALRHRVILNFEAEAKSITPDTVIRSILQSVKEEAKG